MQGNCLICLMRHMSMFLSFTNDFSKANCRHLQNYSNECYLEIRRGRKYFITTLQIFICCMEIYNFISILKHLLKHYSSTFTVFDFLIDFSTIIFLIEYHWHDKEILAETKEFLYISQCIENLKRNDFYFSKWYWLPYCILVPEFFLYSVYEITLLIWNGVNTMTLIKMFLNIIVGE